jgi:hypothetical protein
LQALTANAFYVAPVRSVLANTTALQVLGYNPTTDEIAYGAPTVPVYTATDAALTAGTVGQMIAISDSPTSGGRLAFWDTTNSRWSYVSDNTAV